MLITIDTADKEMSVETKIEMIKLLGELLLKDQLDIGDYQLTTFEQDGKIGFIISPPPDIPKGFFKSKLKPSIH